MTAGWRCPDGQPVRYEFEWPSHGRLPYGLLMKRLVCLSIVVVLSLLSVVAYAAPAHKRPVSHWHGYGFLPGYHQPLNNSQPLYGRQAAIARIAQRARRPWYIDPVPRYYGYDGNWHYFGRPGFYRRPLQWRRLWPVLDADTCRTDLELRLIA